MEFQRPLSEDAWRALRGRCISCGYLCKRIDLLTSTVFEASAQDRSLFNLVSHPESWRGTRIWCFVHQEPLYEEFARLTAEYGASRDNAEISGEIITRDIKCPQWIEYTPFKSAKEHREDFLMQQLEQDRRKFESHLVDMQMNADRRIGRVGIWIGVAAIVLAVAEILTMNEDAFLWKKGAELIAFIGEAIN